MKYLVAIFVSYCCVFTSLFAQVTSIPNGGFENNNPDGSLQNWGNVYLFSVSIDTTGNVTTDSVIFDNGYFYAPTSDAHSGNQALVLSNAFIPSQNKVMIGAVSSDEDTVFTAWGGFETVPYQLRAKKLSFYYKFHAEGNDSAIVELSLFDQWNESGFARKIITSPQEEYTYVEIPVTFYSSNILPNVSYALRISAFYTADASETLQGHFGTRLWIDDIEISEYSTDIAENLAENAVVIAPNPVQEGFTLHTPATIKSISVVDIIGRAMPLTFLSHNQINCQQWANGVYWVTYETEAGRFTQTISKQ